MLSLALLSFAFAPAEAADLEAQVRAIFDDRCTACHDAAADTVVLEGSLHHLRRAASTGTPYVKPGDPEGSYLYQKLLGTAGIVGDPMPLGEDPLPPEQLAVVRDWIAGLPIEASVVSPTPPGGTEAPRTGPAEPPTEAAALAELEGRVRAIFEDSCVACHDASADTVALEGTLEHLRGKSSAGLAYVVPGKPSDSYLYLKVIGAPEIAGAPMPLGEDALPPEQIEDIRDWIAAMPPTAAPASPPAAATPPAPVPRRRPTPAFGGTHQIALHTTTTLGKKAVEFRIHHRFGQIQRPFHDRTFFGLASGATMSLGVAYGIVDGLDVLLRWTNARLGHELGFKYVPVRQEAGMPLSFGLYASYEQFWEQKPLQGCVKDSHCATGNVQAMLSRLWLDRWATQLTVGYSALTNHSPLVALEKDGETKFYRDHRGTLDVGLASTVWLDKKKKWGLDLEYFLPIPVARIGDAAGFYYHGGDVDPDGPMIGGWSLGLCARAGLHFFQVFATNVQNIHTNLVAPGGDTGVPFSREGAHFFVGFNLSRKWNL